MSLLNSKIILCKGINLDKEYKNVLNYSESEMVELCNNKAVAVKEHYSFIKPNENKISVEISYSNCLKSNYIAFQNPYYENKWFFAFIDDVEYSSEKATIIYFTIDAWSTWFNKITPKKCFVIREHVNSDNLYEHTLPENVETGDYIIQSENTADYNGFNICVALTEDKLRSSESIYHNFYNGVVSGLTFVVLQSASDFNYLIFKYNETGQIDLINSVFMIPSGYVPAGGWITDATGLVHYKYIANSTAPFNLTNVTVSRPSRLGEGDAGYLPKNWKLFSYPYCYIQADNNAGGNVVYKYEDFKAVEGQSFNNILFDVKGTINAGCSIKYLPRNYKNLDGLNYNEGFSGAKIPIGGWINDVYKNWLAQNGVNIALNIAGNVLQISNGLGMTNSQGQNVGGSQVASGVLGIAQTIGQVYQHSMIPNQAMGNVNSSDIMFSSGKIGASFYQMSIKLEYAKIIDDYFSRFGYLVNSLKVPNITGRTYYNYIKISESDDIGDGDIPNNYLETINRICHQGVTIWHQHENMGNYSLNNSLH